MSEYNATSIRVLEGLSAVRKRPAMYIGDVGKKGFHHLLMEVVDNSIDEALAGYCTEINIRIRKDGAAEVSDNGRGIPTDIHPEYKISALEIVTTKLHAGGKFDKKTYQVSGGLHGVGISVVNALSEWMEVIVKRDGKIFRQRYERGVPKSPVEVIGETNETGTTVIFKPDKEIFREVEWDVECIKNRLRELAFLNPIVRLNFEDERSGIKESFKYEGGLVEFVKYLNEGKEIVNKTIIHANKKSDNIVVDYAIQYNTGYYETFYSYVNNIRTEEGGTHVIGFKSALTRAMNDFIKEYKITKKDIKITGDDVKEGLTAVLHVLVPEPQFEGQTKAKLGNSEVKGIVSKIVYETLKEWLRMHSDEAILIAKKLISAVEARLAARKAKEMVRRKSFFETNSLPGKLADCIENNPDKAELFIVEGESAGGSAKQGRDRRFQAILPLKGKILNVEKAAPIKVLKNDEIKSIILALGTGIGDEFDINKLRYKKIIIMTDADVDGSHIRTLLLTLFFRYMRPIIEKGYLYIAQPPLYKIKKGKKEMYAYSDEELEKIKKGLGEDVYVQRYKGLGEMNPSQLWETTMNPKTRILKRVTIEDAEKADKLFKILMGEIVEPRRRFIEKHALEVKSLDV